MGTETLPDLLTFCERKLFFFDLKVYAGTSLLSGGYISMGNQRTGFCPFENPTRTPLVAPKLPGLLVFLIVLAGSGSARRS